MKQGVYENGRQQSVRGPQTSYMAKLWSGKNLHRSYIEAVTFNTVHMLHASKHSILISSESNAKHTADRQLMAKQLDKSHGK